MAFFDFFSNIFVQKSAPVQKSDFMSKQIGKYTQVIDSIPTYNPNDITAFELDRNKCYIMAEANDTLKNVLYVVNRETFKEGYDIQPKYRFKCLDCGAEYDREVEICENDKCKSSNLIEPDEEEKKRLETTLDIINRNDESVIKLFKQIEKDLNIVDEAYILNTGEDEYYRLHPLSIKPIISEQGLLGHDEGGRMLVFQTYDRTQVFPLDEEQEIPEGHVSADYLSNDGKYYNRRELIRIHKFDDGLHESYPPVMTLWDKLYMLNKMDEYLALWYAGKRPAKGIMVFNTDDPISMQKQLADQALNQKKNPHSLMTIYTDLKDAKKLVEYLPLTPTPSELDSEATRDNIRRYIAGFYGILPLYMGDVSNTGGLNNETLQLTVTRDTILSNVRRYDKILELIAKRLEINDWVVTIKLPDEIKMTRSLELENQKIDVAIKKQNLGYEMEYDEDTDDWELGEKREAPTEESGVPFKFDEQF